VDASRPIWWMPPDPFGGCLQTHSVDASKPIWWMPPNPFGGCTPLLRRQRLASCSMLERARPSHARYGAEQALHAKCNRRPQAWGDSSPRNELQYKGSTSVNLQAMHARGGVKGRASGRDRGLTPGAHLSVRTRAPASCVRLALQDDHPRPLSHHKTRPSCVKGARGLLRGLVVLHSQGLEA